MMEKNYWNEFYSEKKALVPSNPSRFAILTKDLVPSTSVLIDFGCGNGRDSIYFSEHMYKVYAIDASQEATRIVGSSELHNITQLLGSTEVLGDLLKSLNDTSAPIVLYARFLLHAIDDETENSLLKIMHKFKHKLHYICLEYRTIEDSQLTKEFGEHFRRYINHESLIASLKNLGFSIYSTSKGRGFSIYGSDDPYLGRIVIKGNGD
jgi:SAM-dependent methyltransferase